MNAKLNAGSRLTARGVSKTVDAPEGRLTIVQNIDLQIEAGESVAIVGASGAGKSTLLGLLAGLDLPCQGDISIGGNTLNELDEDGRAALRANHVGFIFQNFQLLPHLTALENVLLPVELADGNAPDKSLAENALEKVGLAERRHHYPNQLSGGEQQRAAIARAFINRPSLLFADEPTGNLDEHTGEQVATLLFNLNRDFGTTLILVTHNRELAERCDRTLVMSAGTLEPDA